jgi:hypothetical protein
MPPVRTADAGGTALAAPAVAYCYQEDLGDDGPRRYGVHCHAEAAACDKARGPNPKRLQSACEAVDLSVAGSQLRQRGWGGSWYSMQPRPFGLPFPQLPEKPVS